MKVKEFIEVLKKLPQDADIYYEGGEFLYDYREIYTVSGVKNTGWGKEGVVINDE